MTITKPKCIVRNNEVYERRLVHKFVMYDTDDPELLMAEPIYNWQQTEHGQWVMKHGIEHTYHVHQDFQIMGHGIAITAHITPKRWTEYILRGWPTY